jgi:hypothetical protein
VIHKLSPKQSKLDFKPKPHNSAETTGETPHFATFSDVEETKDEVLAPVTAKNDFSFSNEVTKRDRERDMMPPPQSVSKEVSVCANNLFREKISRLSKMVSRVRTLKCLMPQK